MSEVMSDSHFYKTDKLHGLYRCEECGVELDSYVSKWGATVQYHYKSKFCHICLENRIKARYKKKQGELK